MKYLTALVEQVSVRAVRIFFTRLIPGFHHYYDLVPTSQAGATDTSCYPKMTASIASSLGSGFRFTTFKVLPSFVQHSPTFYRRRFKTHSFRKYTHGGSFPMNFLRRVASQFICNYPLFIDSAYLPILSGISLSGDPSSNSNLAGR
ncbi:MAG TPA: hypothetical protein VFC65_01105 [Prolixibacteraceae bacterium]|nr:hypothetical protein [Prolixibacteraceae bacterium]